MGSPGHGTLPSPSTTGSTNQNLLCPLHLSVLALPEMLYPIPLPPGRCHLSMQPAELPDVPQLSRLLLLPPVSMLTSESGGIRMGQAVTGCSQSWMGVLATYSTFFMPLSNSLCSTKALRFFLWVCSPVSEPVCVLLLYCQQQFQERREQEPPWCYGVAGVWQLQGFQCGDGDREVLPSSRNVWYIQMFGWNVCLLGEGGLPGVTSKLSLPPVLSRQQKFQAHCLDPWISLGTRRAACPLGELLVPSLCHGQWSSGGIVAERAGGCLLRGGLGLLLASFLQSSCKGVSRGHSSGGAGWGEAQTCWARADGLLC